jgi:AGZA family xanthine/uracil permease-like MFS transporter
MINYFKLNENHTTVYREMLAGFTTFLTMSYVVIVNPLILSKTGMDLGSVFTATCLAAIVGCLLMAFIANYPIVLAPSMGLNAYFTYTVVIGLHYAWQSALLAVFISGLLFLLLTVLNVRQAVIKALPDSLKASLAAGVGLFLAFIALKDAGLIVGNPNTFVQLGAVMHANVILTFLGFCLIVALDKFKVPGSMIISIFVVTLISIVLGFQHYAGIVSLPPSMKPTFFALNFKELLNMGLLSIMFVFFFVSFFDATGTLIGVTQNTHLIDDKGNLKNINKALTADSLAVMSGALLGVSTTGCYLESASGIRAGGRTGLTAVVVAGLFLLTLFFSPLLKTVPFFATSPALLFVGCLMMQSILRVNWNDITEIVPAIITTLLMPLTFSIANGLAAGLITYVVIKLMTFRWKELNIILVVLALIAVFYFCVPK